MNQMTLQHAITLAQRLGHIFISTVSPNAMPHLAAAGRIAIIGELVEVTAWFCPTTVVNLRGNRAVSLVAWDSSADRGYQLLGQVLHIEEVAMLDGYLPQQEDSSPLPQVERKLLIRVEQILDFRHAPHSDLEAE